MDLSRYIRRSARYWPNATAVVHDTRNVTFRELDRRSNRIANALLGLGMRKGDRVAVQAWNCPEIVEVETALYKVGLVKAPVNARLSPTETEAVLADSGATAFICSADHISVLQDARIGFSDVRHRISLDGDVGGWQSYESMLSDASDASPIFEHADNDLAVLHYTSGSTGRLKAAMQSYGNRHAALRVFLLGKLGVAGPGEKMAMLGPLTHATGMLIQPLLANGATLRVFDKFDVERFLRAVQTERITHAFMVPTMVQMLLAHPDLHKYDLSSLKSLSYGAAPMSAAVLTEAWERIGPVLNQGYGAGETTGGVLHFSVQEHAHALRHRPERLLSCGRPWGEADVRVVNEEGRDVEEGEIGEIVVAGPTIYHGYWNAPELTAETMKGVWWHSGDLARVDDEGFIYIVDRKKDMIISGGFNIYTIEVEQSLYSHPAVAEACVFGVPDEKWGEAVQAAVVLKAGHTVSEDALISHCEQTIAGFKKPRAVEFLAELPKNQNGKVARKVLRDRFWKDSIRKV